MPKTVDPVFSSSVLAAADLATALDIDALTQSLAGLEGKVDKNPKTAAIILAGGTGERFGKEGGKQLVEIGGKPILTWSVEAFDAVGDIGLIVIVCPAERQGEYLSKAVDPFSFATPIVVAAAGSTRQESAFSGLELVPEEFEYVVMHDGARPLISADLIAHTIHPQGQHRRRRRRGGPSRHRYAESRGKRRHRRHARPQRVLERANPAGVPCGHLPPCARLGALRRLCRHR